MVTSKVNFKSTFLSASQIIRPNNEVDSPREVTGTGGKRLHDFGGMSASHPRDKRRSTLLCHLMFIACRQRGEKYQSIS